MKRLPTAILAMLAVSAAVVGAEATAGESAEDDKKTTPAKPLVSFAEAAPRPSGDRFTPEMRQVHQWIRTEIHGGLGQEKIDAAMDRLFAEFSKHNPVVFVPLVLPDLIRLAPRDKRTVEVLNRTLEEGWEDSSFVRAWLVGAALEQEDIGKYFVAQRPFLSESFRKERLSELLEKSKDQEFKPKRSLPLKDPRCFAEVSRINNKEVYIKILKPLGAWRWHHHFQCLAMYKTQRNKTIDDIFALDELYAKLSFTFQGFGHGMAGPNIRSKDNAITKALGEPDYKYPSQSPSLGRYYYEKHDLHIVTHGFVVYYVEKGKPDWVEDVKTE